MTIEATSVYLPNDDSRRCLALWGQEVSKGELNQASAHRAYTRIQ